MELDSTLISQFVKSTKDTDRTKKESIVYGVVVEVDDNDVKYVKIDGSNIITPVNTTADIVPGERVTVMIKNHTAIITGNITSPAARSRDVTEVKEDLKNAATNGDVEALAAVVGDIIDDVGNAQNDITKIQNDVTTLKEVVLYDHLTGSNGVITLSQPVTNFKYMEAYYSLNNGTSISNSANNSVKIYSPNFKWFTMYSIASNGSQSIFCQTEYNAENNTLTPYTEGSSAVHVATDEKGAVTISRNQGTNWITVYRVVGYM